MGRSVRWKPARLAAKLLQIRKTLGLSQNVMLDRMGLSGKLERASVSGYESGKRVPPLPVLLKYARAFGVSADVLIDDELDLPATPPSKSKRK